VSTRHGLGDPRIPWTILLRADGVRSTPDDAAPVHTTTVADQLRRLAGERPDPVAIARVGDTLVIAADHARLDGLSLLAVLERELGVPVRSTAAGVGGGRPQRRLSTVLWQRAVEVALRPPAVVAGSPGASHPGDAFASARHEGRVSTSRLVVAAAAAIARWNREHGARDRRVSVAVGVSTVGGAEATIGDHSGFLRLTDVEAMSPDQVRRAIASAALQPGGAPAGAGILRAMTTLLAPRLGSTLLVSHLGEVETSGCDDLAFYPVTGGASGVSLGAVGIAGRTTITLRARGADHDEDGLRSLLETVLGELG